MLQIRKAACALALITLALDYAEAQVLVPQDHVTVLMYHQVTDTKPSGPTVVSPQSFRLHMEALTSAGYKTIGLRDLSRWTEDPIYRLANPRCVVITFDDGWASVVPALTTMARFKMTSTLFLISGALNTPEYMTSHDVRWAKSQGHEIGGHSHTHYTRYEQGLQIAEEEQVKEMMQSKFLLERDFGPITHYAWPYGLHTANGVQTAFSVGITPLSVNNESKVTVGWASQVPRINVDGRCTGPQVVESVKTGKVCTP